MGFFGKNGPFSLSNKARFVSKASFSKDIDIKPFQTWNFDKPRSIMELTDVPTLVVSSSESVSIDSLEESDMIIVGVMDDNEEEPDDESEKDENEEIKISLKGI